MKNEIHERKMRIAHEVLIVLGVLALILMVMSLWPIVLLLIPVIIICALRLLFLKLRTVEVLVPAPEAPPPPPETELSITQRAFGLLQRRITEQLALQHPGTRWVWGTPNALERFTNNEPLVVFLNSAGGFNKAQVSVHNLVFKGIYYGNAAPQTVLPANSVVKNKINISGKSKNDIDDTDDIEEFDETDTYGAVIVEDVPVNYGRLAFEWVDSNISDINAKYNEAIAQNENEMLIPAEDLPHPDSWPDICDELKRNGFSVADFCDNGIKVNITN